MVINNQSKRKKLPIDIISINCKNPEESLKALDYCKSFFKFENSILFTDENIEQTEHSVIKINKFRSIHDYSNFVLTLKEYINSEHVLVIQDDGHIVNPDIWDDNFLDYDYIGAPWPTEYNFRKRWKKEKGGARIARRAPTAASRHHGCPSWTLARERSILPAVPSRAADPTSPAPPIAGGPQASGARGQIERTREARRG